jgi:Transposase DDE domain
MASKDNLLLKVAALSMVVCRRHLQAYSCPKSNHLYTQPQLMSCLVLKAYLKQTYRGFIEQLEVSQSLSAALGLERLPSHTTLKEFEKRAVTPQLLDGIVGQVLALCQEAGVEVNELAGDSTGLETTTASSHFLTRSKRKREGYVKLSLAVACGSILLVSMALDFGPSSDLTQTPELLWRASGRCRPQFAFFDQGYECEWVHQLCRDGMGTLSYIPPVPRTHDGSIRTLHRARCARYRPANATRRWHVESFISGMKRCCGSTLRAKTKPALLNEAGLIALAYAIRR